MRALFGAAAIALASACTIVTNPSASTGERLSADIPAEGWLEASEMFYRSDWWLGGDAATTIPLGPGKTLWLFGDTYVARGGGRDRTQAAMVNNSIAVQVGPDPRSAQFYPYVGAKGTEPASFFDWPEGEWLWPLHGVRIGHTLTIFCARARKDDGPFGFAPAGWTALRVDHPDAPPDQWVVHTLAVPAFPSPLWGGVSVVHLQGWVFAYAAFGRGGARPDAFLMRWPEAQFVAGQLAEPEWWVGTGWAPQQALGGWPAPAMKEAAPEFSVIPHPTRGFVAVHTVGFPVGDLAVRFADRLEGPWTEAAVVFRAPEASDDQAMIYAGKAHPELSGGGLVTTYVPSGLDLGQVLRSETLYYPKFVRVQLPPR